MTLDTARHRVLSLSVAEGPRSTRSAFTLVEVLVSMAIFVVVMLISTVAFAHFQRIGRHSAQAMAIAAKADALGRDLDNKLGHALTHAAMYLRRDPDGYWKLVFMHPLRWIEGHRYGVMVLPHLDAIYNTIATRCCDRHRHSDLVWAVFDWRGGALRYAHSRLPRRRWDRIDIDNSHWTQNYDSHLRPVVQRSIAHLMGRTDVPSESGYPYRRGPLHDRYDRSERNTSTNQMREYGDGRWGDPKNDERHDEYRPWFGQVFEFGMFGDRTPLPGTFVVANPDGRSYNRNWMALVGHPDLPLPESDLATTHRRFPDMRMTMVTGIEYFEIEALDGQGKIMTGEDDTLGDEGASMDWLGVVIYGRSEDTWRGQGPISPADRPAALRCRYLIHDVPRHVLDVDDIDGDGNREEPLIDALRAKIDADAGLVDPAARRAAMRKALDRHGYLALEYRRTVRLPL